MGITADIGFTRGVDENYALTLYDVAPSPGVPGQRLNLVGWTFSATFTGTDGALQLALQGAYFVLRTDVEGQEGEEVLVTYLPGALTAPMTASGTYQITGVNTSGTSETIASGAYRLFRGGT